MKWVRLIYYQNIFLLSSSDTNNVLDNNIIINEKNIHFNKYQNFIKKENFITKLDRLIISVKTNMKILEDTLDLNRLSSDDNPIHLLQEMYRYLKIIIIQPLIKMLKKPYMKYAVAQKKCL